MPQEIFDVVNERDEVIGREARDAVHRLGLRHRAVHILVFNSRGELFLQKRSMSKDTFPGAWDSSAAGHLDCGEDYDTCALRELREELGLEPGMALVRLFKIEACAETGQEFVWVYRCVDEGPFTLHPEEIETGDWFTPERITRWMEERPRDFASALIMIWNEVLGRGLLDATHRQENLRVVMETDLNQIASLLVSMGCPEGKSLEMAAQLDKRARQLAAHKNRRYEDALTHLLTLMRQGWAARERGL